MKYTDAFIRAITMTISEFRAKTNDRFAAKEIHVDIRDMVPIWDEIGQYMKYVTQKPEATLMGIPIIIHHGGTTQPCIVFKDAFDMMEATVNIGPFYWGVEDD